MKAYFAASRRSRGRLLPKRFRVPAQCGSAARAPRTYNRRMRFVVVSLILALGVTACVKQRPQEPSGGTATLRWDPVEKDTSGKPLTHLAGYTIRYGPSDKAMWYTIKVRNPRQTTYVVKDLFPGTWYFSVSAYTSSGIEGAPSPVASKTIN